MSDNLVAFPRVFSDSRVQHLLASFAKGPDWKKSGIGIEAWQGAAVECLFKAYSKVEKCILNSLNPTLKPTSFTP